MLDFISGLALIGAAGCLIILIQRADLRIQELNKKIVVLKSGETEK